MKTMDDKTRQFLKGRIKEGLVTIYQNNKQTCEEYNFSVLNITALICECAIELLAGTIEADQYEFNHRDE